MWMRGKSGGFRVVARHVGRVHSCWLPVQGKGPGQGLSAAPG